MLNDRSTKPDTRDRILEAAFSVLSRQGYENTSIKDIAEEAGVAQGLIHYHFKSKEQLVLSVLAEVCRAGRPPCRSARPRPRRALPQGRPA